MIEAGAGACSGIGTESRFKPRGFKCCEDMRAARQRTARTNRLVRVDVLILVRVRSCDFVDRLLCP